MKTFLGDAFCFVGAGAVLLTAAWLVSETVDPVHYDVRRRMELLHQRRDTVEVVSVGSSHAGAIDFGTLGVQGFHLWRNQSDVFETAYYAREALDQAPGVRLVLVTVSFPSLYADTAVGDNESARRRAMYAMSRSFRWLPGDRDRYLAAKVEPIVRPDHWHGVVRRLLGAEAARVEVGRDGAWPDEPESPLRLVEWVHQARKRAAAHLSLAQGGAGRHPARVARTVAELDTLAATLGVRGGGVVFYTPPFSYAYTEAFDTAKIAEMREAMEALDRRHATAVWLDYSIHPALVREPRYFRDGDHLNRAGARAFSALLGTCLRALPHRGPECGRVTAYSDAVPQKRAE